MKMKKTIASLLLVGSLVVGNVTPAFATGSYICASKTMSDLPNVYTDSDHWRKTENGRWMCADENFHQALYERWVATDGKWYFVNKFGYMATDTYIIDHWKNTKYYVDENGVCVTGNLFQDHERIIIG